MTVAAALAVLDAHLVLAGTAITPAITNVAQGERQSKDRRIDYWIEDIGDPARMDGNVESLTDRMFGLQVTVRVSLPARDQRETLIANLEADLATVSVNIAIRLLADANLGGECTSLAWAGTPFGWVRDGDGTWTRISNTTVTLDFVETVAISL